MTETEYRTWKKSFYEKRQKIFCEEKITHPFFNQECADVLKNSFKWFVDSDIKNEAVKKCSGISKDELIIATEYAINDILKVNSERLKESTDELIFACPYGYEMYRDILKGTEQICCGIKKNIKCDTGYLTENGKRRLRSLYRNYFDVTGATDNLIEIEYLYCIHHILYYIYSRGLPHESEY